MPLSRSEAEDLARRYQCSTRTVRRIAARGIDPANVRAVGEYLAKIKTPSPAMLAAVLKILPS